MLLLLEFLYRGSVAVPEDRKDGFLDAARELRVLGFMRVLEEENDGGEMQPDRAADLIDPAASQQQQQHQRKKRKQVCWEITLTTRLRLRLVQLVKIGAFSIMKCAKISYLYSIRFSR
jgi:hypothetical protein